MHTTVPGDLRARLVGINHVALEVSDVDAAVVFYGKIFSFEVMRRTSDAAFITMGDQFLALNQNGSSPGSAGEAATV